MLLEKRVSNVIKGKIARERIYKYIKEYIAEHDYAPSYREIATNCGFKSHNTVYNHMMKMLDMGIIETDLHVGNRKLSARAYRLGEYNE